MKKNILFLLALCFAINLHAQEITIETPGIRSFSGVKSINGEIIFTSWFGEKTDNKGMANFVLKLYDKDLKEIKTTTIELTKYSELASYAFSGKYFLFIFVDALKKNRTMITLDAQGNTVQRKSEEDVRRALLIAENFPVIHVLNDEEFLLLRPMRDKKFGFDIERLDKNLVSKWTKSHIPEDGILKAQDSKIQDNKLYLLREQNPTRYSDNFVYSVQCFDLATGDQLYSTDLVNGDDGGAPSFIRIASNGDVATGGMYFKGGKYDDKNSDGLFFSLISSAGAISQFTKTSWNSIKEKISGEFSSALIGGKTKIMVEDVIKKSDGTYMVICEQFKKANNANMTGVGAALGGTSASTGTSEVGFTVLDFVFFNFDNSGKLTTIDVVKKESKEARVTGKIATEKGLAIAQYMYGRGFFSYKGTFMQNDKQIILYRNDEGFKSRAYFLPVGAKSTEGIPSIDMDRWVSEKLNKVGMFSKAVSGNQYTFNSDSFSNDYELYKNIAAFKPGSMLLYDYNTKGLKIWLEPVPVQ
jgi:hypothetical protein